MRIFIIDVEDSSMDSKIFSSKKEAITYLEVCRQNPTYGVDYFEISTSSRSEHFLVRQSQLGEVSCDSLFDTDIDEIIQEIKDWRKPESTGTKGNGNITLIKACITIMNNKNLPERLREHTHNMFTNILANQDDSTYPTNLVEAFNASKNKE